MKIFPRFIFMKIASGKKKLNANLDQAGTTRWVLLFIRFWYYLSRMTTITCKIPEKLDAELEAMAEKCRVPKSQIVRQALEANLLAQKKRFKLSAHDMMKAACGIIKGGPRDRSWNRKHMEGFGRD